jgi:hypothetical protein
MPAPVVALPPPIADGVVKQHLLLATVLSSLYRFDHTSLLSCSATGHGHRLSACWPPHLVHWACGAAVHISHHSQIAMEGFMMRSSQ